MILSGVLYDDDDNNDDGDDDDDDDYNDDNDDNNDDQESSPRADRIFPASPYRSCFPFPPWLPSPSS